MPSFVWDRDVEEAYDEPYEYPGQEQFSREAKKIISILKNHLSKLNRTFKCHDKSLGKAIWMLQVDALEALNDALILIDEKKHRIAVRLFRDIIETLDIAMYFSMAGDAAKKDLENWFNNEVISHRKYRDFIKNRFGEIPAKELSNIYSDFSKYTHRTFRAIGMSYILGQENKIVYDGFEESDILVLPHVISFSYAVLAILIKRFIKTAIETRQLSLEESEDIWKQCLEKETVPRRFGNGPGQMLRGPLIEINYN